MAAFRKSVEAGVDGVEFDVHRCATGELVVIHDDDLPRTTNGAGYVKEASYAELQRLSAGLWFDEKYQNERVPLLSDVLSLFNDKMLINIELKNAPMGYDGIEEDLLAELEHYQHRKNVVVSSFDHLLLRRLHALDETIAIGILGAAMLVDIKEYAAKFGAKHYMQAFDCFLPEARKEAADAGISVLVWTVNERKEWERAIQMNIDGIITDDPEGLALYLRQSG